MIVKPVIEGVKEALSLWRVFIETRQKAYERKKDKKQERAIAIAEKSYETMNDLFEIIYRDGSLKDSAEYKKIKVLLIKQHKKFNKYD